MTEEIYTHEDNRRVLIEWIEDSKFVTSKVVIAKDNCIVGDHYHKKKDEIFLLLIGKAKRVIIGNSEEHDIPALRKWIVKKGAYHLFDLEQGSILLGCCTKKFDPKDEIKRA